MEWNEHEICMAIVKTCKNFLKHAVNYTVTKMIFEIFFFISFHLFHYFIFLLLWQPVYKHFFLKIK